MFIKQKSAEMAIFHIILWKNAVSAYFFCFIKQKNAETVIFHIILWKNAILAFFFVLLCKKVLKWRFSILLYRKCHFGIFALFY
jgi:hypothetical protein